MLATKGFHRCATPSHQSFDLLVGELQAQHAKELPGSPKILVAFFNLDFDPFVKGQAIYLLWLNVLNEVFF